MRHTHRISTSEIILELLAVFVSLFLFLTAAAHAQTATGIPMYSTMANGPIDHINVGDLGVSLIVPVRSKTGPIPLNFIWYQQTFCDMDRTNAPQVIFNCNHGVSADHGIATQPVDGTIQFGTADLVNCPDLLDGEKYTHFVFFDGMGTVHSFGPSTVYQNHWHSGGNSNCSPTSASFMATDGSGYTLFVQAPICTQGPNGNICPALIEYIYDAAGNKIVFGGTSSVTDANGNQITRNVVNSVGDHFTYNYNDALGTTIVAKTFYCCGATSSETLTYPDAAGGSQTFTVNYSPITLLTNFSGCSATNMQPLSKYIPTSLILPDGSQYAFAYEVISGVIG